MRLNYFFIFLLLQTIFLFSTKINAQTILPTNAGPTGIGVPPPGWTMIYGFTDVSNVAFWGGVLPWFSIVEDCPNGHAQWATGRINEVLGTTISDLDIGEIYTMRFYMCELLTGASIPLDGTLQVMIEGEEFLFPFSGGLDPSWSLESLSFEATDISMEITFNYLEAVGSHSWNISISGDAFEIACDLLDTDVSETEICFGDAVTLTATSINGGTVTWDGGVVDGESFEPPVGITTYTATSDYEDDCVFTVDITVNELPDVIATAVPEEICLGQTVTVYGGGADTYEWDMDVENGVEFEPLTAGTETYTVTGTDEFGCINTASVDVTVTPAPVANFEFIINGVSSEDGLSGGCFGGEVQFNDLSIIEDPGVIVSWDWDFGDGGDSDEENPTHTYDIAGTYTITLTVTIAGGCSATYELDIIITEGLILDIIFNNPTCFGFTDGSVTVIVSGGIGDLIFEIIDEDDVLLNVDNSNTANTLGEGWYYINVSDDSECSGLDSIYLTEPSEIAIEIDLMHPLCFGFETGAAVVREVFNYTGGDDMISYVWSPNPAGNNGLGEDSTWAMGAGDFTLTINDENGCSKVFDFTITEPEEMVFAEFGFEHTFCRLHEYQSGNGVVFGAASGGMPDYSYLWKNLDNGGESVNSTWGGLNPGNYELTAIDANGCILKESLYLDSLNPVAAFTVNSAQLNEDCQGTATIDVEFINESVNFANPNNPAADTTFFWNLDDPAADWQVTHDYFEIFDTIYTAKGQSYTVDVCLVAINKNGCADTACKVITIYEPIVFTDINIFTPNGDGTNDLFSFDFKSASISEFNCVIVNRWGIVVFEMNDISDAWDGTDKSGSSCNDGTYFYTYLALTDGGTKLKGQGTVLISR